MIDFETLNRIAIVLLILALLMLPGCTSSSIDDQDWLRWSETNYVAQDEIPCIVGYRPSVCTVTIEEYKL